MGPPTELPELNCWSIEKHAGHLARWIELFCFVLAVLASPFKSKLRPEAENARLCVGTGAGFRRYYGVVRHPSAPYATVPAMMSPPTAQKAPIAKTAG
jgi:hypothetical protein